MVDQTETSAKWNNFKSQLKDIWIDLQDRDLRIPPETFEELVNCIQAGTEETREEVRRKIEFLVKRFNIPFEPDESMSTDV